jgi:Transposase IS116/IS110/IS902 family
MDMARFPRAAHLASWAGVCPGNRRSAGKQRSGAATKGTTQLKTILCEIAATIARSPGTYLHAFYHRIARRRGKPRAMLAVAHSLLVSVYHMLRDQACCAIRRPTRTWGHTTSTISTASAWSAITSVDWRLWAFTYS